VAEKRYRRTCAYEVLRSSHGCSPWESTSSLTAEGIEDAGQLARLRELGCELGQGYHFAKPLPEAEVSAFLAAHRRRSTPMGSE